ncbi:MAG: transketolase C-terminal domain-containing protein [Patescibacteria group bacterium]
MTKERIIKYREAVNEAHRQSLDKFKEAFIMGVGVADATGVFGTTKGLGAIFGERVFDTPMSENTLTGIGVGAAITGMRPVLVHTRNDFLLLTMDQIVNHAAKWRYMSGGAFAVPFLIRAIIGRGWGQAAQHSQSLQSLFMHFPGLQVIMPVTPYDAKGMILAAMESDKPTICLEHRWLHDKSGPVPKKYYTVPIGKGRTAREGKDLTIVAISEMVLEAEVAAIELEKEGISVEIIDLRSLRPLDTELILNSVKKTKRLVVCDTSWKMAGASAEILALVAEQAHGFLIAPPIRIALEDTPTPCSSALEAFFYPSSETVIKTVRSMMKSKGKPTISKATNPNHKHFTGPF